MCGIAGILQANDDVLPSTLQQLTRSIQHRGPDGAEVWTGPGIGLCHTRLAILDLSSLATQPMTSHSGRFVITYNGEIFNFRQLRDELQRAGIEVRSTGDTEVLLEYLAHFGIDATVDLEGQFAFALWDRHERTLTLARDRHGIKPLYYARQGDAVCFASELKAFQDFAQPDHASIDAILLGMPCTWGTRTPFRNVQAVRSGEIVVVDRQLTVSTRRFFALTQFVDADLYRELAGAPTEVVLGRIETALQESVDSQLVSDVPLGCLLSGGVDSSLISRLAHARVPSTGLFHANVVSDSETPAARQVAALMSSVLTVTDVDDEDFLELLPEVTLAKELPLTYHPNSIPFYLVCKFAREHGVKVLLTGEGSDEYFLGYAMSVVSHSIVGPVMRAASTSRNVTYEVFSRMFPRAMKVLWPSRDSWFEQFSDLVNRLEHTHVRDDAQQALAHIEDEREREAQMATMSLVEEHLSSLLHRNDRLGMAWGLESRFPFLGHSVARLAVNLPSRYKMHRSWRLHDPKHPFLIDKWCVRRVGEKYLPHTLAYRRKLGFPVGAYSGLTISERFFHDGFVADWYGLSRGTIRRLTETSSTIWLFRLLLMDIWGRLLVHRQAKTDVTHLIRTCISRRGTSVLSRAGSAVRRDGSSLRAGGIG